MKRPATLAALALVLLTVWEIGVLVQSRRTAPRDEDWRQAAAAVEADLQPSDLIVFAPRWVDPVGRLWLGHLIPLAMAGRMDAGRYARIWELSIRDARARETSRLAAPALDRRFGAVRLRRWDQTAPEVVWELSGKEVLEVGHEPHRCQRLGVGQRDLGRVTLGSELVAYAGLADVWARKDNRAYADVRLLLDGVEVSAATVGNESGWLALPVVKTSPGPHHVAFSVAVDPTRGDPRRPKLELCVMAEARK